MHSIDLINYIKKPVSTVFDAITTQEGLGGVWTEKLIVKPELGFVNEFDFNDEYDTKFKVVEMIPGKRVLWECVQSDPEWIGTSLSFDLEERNNETAIVLSHFNWREKTEFYRWCNYNWAQFLYSLKLYCEEGKGKPYQQRKF